MSDGCHANTSTFTRRKAMSALFYLLSMVALMVKVPPAPSSIADTSAGAAFAGRALRHVLNGCATLRRGALPRVLVRGLAGLLLHPGNFAGRSKYLGGRCCNCFPVKFVGADDCVFLVGMDGDDTHRPWHLECVL